MTNCYFTGDISHLLVSTDNLLANLCKYHSQTENSTDCVVPWQSWLYLCRFYYTEAVFDLHTHTHSWLDWARLVMVRFESSFSAPWLDLRHKS